MKKVNDKSRGKLKRSLPKEVMIACKILAGFGKKVFLVGGGVRDLISGVTPNDWDLATDALPAEVAQIFSKMGYKVILTGLKFGTVTVLKQAHSLEITTFRTEGLYCDYRRPGSVCFVKEIGLDLSRRDFTVNAIAYDPVQEAFFDPFGGLNDLHKGEIKTVGDPHERIAEDPLRMLRGIRLAAELGFNLEERTKHAIVRNAELIGMISSERIRTELNRILLSNHFLKGLEILKETGLLFLIIPELKAGWLLAQYNPAHQYTVLDHTFEALRYTPSSLGVRLAVLLHDVAKPLCFRKGEDGRGHFYGHHVLGAEMAEQVLRRLRYSKRVIQCVVLLIREHMVNLKMSHSGLRRFIARVGKEKLSDLLAVRRADLFAHSNKYVRSSLEEFELFCARLQGVMKERVPLKREELAVDGYDVLRVAGCRPSPLVGRVLKELWEEVMDDPAKNERSYLLGRIGEIVKKYLGKKDDGDKGNGRCIDLD